MTPDEHKHMCRRDTGDYGTDEAHLKNTVCGGGGGTVLSVQILGAVARPPSSSPW